MPEATAPITDRTDHPAAAPLSAFVEGQPYSLDRSLFKPADASRLDRITRDPGFP